MKLEQQITTEKKDQNRGTRIDVVSVDGVEVGFVRKVNETKSTRTPWSAHYKCGELDGPSGEPVWATEVLEHFYNAETGPKFAKAQAVQAVVDRHNAARRTGF